MNPRSILSWLPASQQQAVKATARKLSARAVQMAFSYTAPELEAKFRELGIVDGDAILMQSAFRNLNGFAGDAQHVIDCLLDIVGPRGHLFMVSMPYDGSAGEYLSTGKPFDVRKTPSQMGLLSESFRRRRGVVRSANPLHPVLAWGSKKEWIVSGHEELAHSCGKGSPFDRMLELETKALLFDVDLDVLTFAHYLEDLFQHSAPVRVYSTEPQGAEIVDRDGKRRHVAVYTYSPEAMAQRNFAVLYDELIDRGLVCSDRIGNTRLQLVPLREVLDTATDMVAHGKHLFARPGEPTRIAPTRRARGNEHFWSDSSEHTLRRGSDARKFAGRLSARITALVHAMRLPAAVRREVRQDEGGLPTRDPGAQACVSAAVDWLCMAQDHSATGDGGVARSYSLLTGLWSSSYPETTGYIVPTLLDYADRTGDDALRARARRMLDWLVGIQLPDGGFQGGLVDSQPVKPVTFNTGQVLIGLAAGAAAFGDERYVEAMHRAARWLVNSQDADGCWRADPSPFAGAGEKTYDTHVAWGLFEAARRAPGCGYDVAAVKNVRWAITHQRDNGWIGRCCLMESTQPLTHTIGYALRGFIEAHRFTQNDEFLVAARRTADPLIKALGPDGFLTGRLRSDWTPEVSWACLTGTVQIAACWLLLHDITGDARYLEAAERANRYVRRTMTLDRVDGFRGGVKGSFPVNGRYGTYEVMSWAAKFAIDSNLMLLDRTQRAAASA